MLQLRHRALAYALFATSASSTMLSDTIMAQGPTAYWKLDESSGTRLMDSSGNGREATLQKVGSVEHLMNQPGKVGPAIDLQGPSAPASYVKTNYNMHSIMGTSGTMTGLIKVPEVITGSGCGQPNNAGPHVFSTWAYYQGLSVGVNCDRAGLHAWSFYTGSHYTGLGVPVTPGQWVHFAWVQTPSKLCLYVDGAKACKDGPTGDNMQEIFLGAENNGSPVSAGKMYPGKIQHFATFDRALSDTEIQAQYVSTVTPSPPPPPPSPPPPPPTYLEIGGCEIESVGGADELVTSCTFTTANGRRMHEESGDVASLQRKVQSLEEKLENGRRMHEESSDALRSKVRSLEEKLESLIEAFQKL